MLTQDGQALPTPVRPEKNGAMLYVHPVVMLSFRFTAHLVSISGSCGLEPKSLPNDSIKLGHSQEQRCPVGPSARSGPPGCGNAPVIHVCDTLHRCSAT